MVLWHDVSVPEVAPRAAEEFLAAAYPDERERERAERWLGLMAGQGDGPPETTSRSRDLMQLTVRGRIRVCADVTAGVIAAGAVVFYVLLAGRGLVGPTGGLLLVLGALIGLLAVGLVGSAVFLLVTLVASISEMTRRHLPSPSRRTRLILWAIVAVVLALLVATERALLTEIVAFILPAALVLAVGIPLCVLAFRRTRASRSRWRRAGPDVIAAGTVWIALLMLIGHRLPLIVLGDDSLFPFVAAWVLFLVWRTVKGSDRRAVKIGADIAFALLLGGVLVLLFI
jgi:hypothetical protein